MPAPPSSPGTALLLAPLLLLAPACETNCGLQTDIGVSVVTLHGDVGLGPSSGGQPSAQLDIDDSLGIDKDHAAPHLRLHVWYEGTSLTFSQLRYIESGSGILSHDFGDLTQGQPVNTRARFANLMVALRHAVIDTEVLRISPGIGLEWVEFELEAESAGVFERIDFTAPMPTLSLYTEVLLGPVQVSLDVVGSRAELPEFDGSLLDLEAMLRWQPLDPLPVMEVFGGYRLILMDGTERTGGKEYSADLLLDGWMLGIKFIF